MWTHCSLNRLIVANLKRMNPEFTRVSVHASSLLCLFQRTTAPPPMKLHLLCRQVALQIFVKPSREAVIIFFFRAKKCRVFADNMATFRDAEHRAGLISMQRVAGLETFVFFLRNLSSVSRLDLCICTYKR